MPAQFKPTPLIMEADESYVWEVDPKISFSCNVDQVRYICTCGQTKTTPFCDGAHIAYNAKMAGLVESGEGGKI